jgi:hypothetical protein
VRQTLNECRALADQVCRNCWGPGSSTCHNPDIHRRVRRDCSSQGHTHTDTAADSRLVVADSIRGQGNKLAGSNRLVEAHKAAGVWLDPRPTPATNPSRPIPSRHANPSHRRHASPTHRHRASPNRRRAMLPERWRRTGPGSKPSPLIGRQPASVRGSWCALPTTSVELVPNCVRARLVGSASPCLDPNHAGARFCKSDMAMVRAPKPDPLRFSAIALISCSFRAFELIGDRLVFAPRLKPVA